jgi:hypothetical protein
MSGSEFQREKDKVAAIMQEKQQRGEGTLPPKSHFTSSASYQLEGNLEISEKSGHVADIR